jgi:hypothetical protein
VTPLQVPYCVRALVGNVPNQLESDMSTREILIASGLVKPNLAAIAAREKGKRICLRLEAIIARRALLKGLLS